MAGMNLFGRELSDLDARLVGCGLKPLRPMTPEEAAFENERERRAAERISLHPFRYLLCFLGALSFLAFSIWLVCSRF